MDGEKIRVDQSNVGRFESISVVRAARSVTKGGNELGGTPKGGVLCEQVAEKVEAMGLEIGSGVNGRSRRHEKFSGACGATKNESGESGG